MSSIKTDEQEFCYEHIEWLFVVVKWIKNNKPSNPQPALIAHLQQKQVLEGYIKYCQDNYDALTYLMQSMSPAYKNHIQKLATE